MGGSVLAFGELWIGNDTFGLSHHCADHRVRSDAVDDLAFDTHLARDDLAKLVIEDDFSVEQAAGDLQFEFRIAERRQADGLEFNIRPRVHQFE